MELADIRIASQTQSQETISQILEDAGFGEIEVDRVTDRADQPTKSSAPPAAGAPAGEEGKEDTSAATETAPDRHKKPSGSARLKAQLAEREAALTEVKSSVDGLRAELKALEARLAKPAGEPTVAESVTPAGSTTEDPEPQIEDFPDGYDAWYEKWESWDKRQKEQAVPPEAKPAAPKPAGEPPAAVNTEWQEAIEGARQRHDDFDEVVQNPGYVVSPAMVQVIQDLEDGAELVYWLGHHVEESKRIAKVTELGEKFTQREVRTALYRARTELEALLPKLSEATPPPAPPVPAPPKLSAPAKFTPPTPVGSRGAPTTRPITERTAEELRRLSPEDYRKFRESGTA